MLLWVIPCAPLSQSLHLRLDTQCMTASCRLLHVTSSWSQHLASSGGCRCVCTRHHQQSSLACQRGGACQHVFCAWSVAHCHSLQLRPGHPTEMVLFMAHLHFPTTSGRWLFGCKHMLLGPNNTAVHHSADSQETSQQRSFNRKGRHCFWVPQINDKRRKRRKRDFLMDLSRWHQVLRNQDIYSRIPSLGYLGTGSRP